MSLNYVQCNTFYQAGSGVIVGATSIVLTSFTDIYGNTLTMADFGSKGYGSCESDTTNEESFTFTGVTANANGTFTLTGVKTALAKSPYTETSGLVRAHAGGTKVVVSDTTAFWNTFANKNNDETVTGRWGSAVAPLAGNDYVNKTYADGLAIAGSPDSSTTVKGIGKVSVAPVSATSPIFVGDNDTRVPTASQALALAGNNTDVAVGSGNKYVTQTGLQHNAEKYAADTSGSSTAYVVTLSPAPTSLTDGMVVYAKIVNANTTTTPTLNVNSLGAKTIVKFAGSAIAIGDILANQFCEFIYDLTNTRWILKNPVIVFPSTSGVSTGPASSSTQTITHSLGRVPVIIRTHCNGDTSSSTANPSIAYGVYDSSGNRCVYTKGSFSGDPATSTTYSLYIDKSTATTGNATGIIGNVTSTSFDIVWTVTSSVANCSFIWEAQ